MQVWRQMTSFSIHGKESSPLLRNAFHVFDFSTNVDFYYILAKISTQIWLALIMLPLLHHKLYFRIFNHAWKYNIKVLYLVWNLTPWWLVMFALNLSKCHFNSCLKFTMLSWDVVNFGYLLNKFALIWFFWLKVLS